MSRAATALLAVMLVSACWADVASAVPVEYYELVESGEHLAIVYPASPNAVITGYLTGGGDSIAFWVTAPSGQTVIGNSSLWAGDATQFEFMAHEDGAYIFHVQNRVLSPFGVPVTLVIDSRVNQNNLALTGLVLAAAIVGAVVGVLLWTRTKLRRQLPNVTPLRGRRKLVRATAPSSVPARC